VSTAIINNVNVIVNYEKTYFMPRIFISYRRADSIAITGRIHDRLETEFGDENVFKDVDDIPLGADFRAVLDREVGACDVLLVIIGTQWASIAHPDGRKRLFDAGDFVRIEVESGLIREDVTVIPVLAGGANMPNADDLPESLRLLLYLNAATVRHDPDFRRDMTRLIRELNRHFESLGAIEPYLNQLDELDNDAPWSEIETLLEQSMDVANESQMLIGKVQGRRKHWLSVRVDKIEHLLTETEDLMRMDTPDIERVKSLLEQVERLAPDHEQFTGRIDSIKHDIAKWQQAEENRRRTEAERQQKIERLLTEAEQLGQEDFLDVEHIKLLLEQVDSLANDGDSIQERQDTILVRINQWEKHQAQLKQEEIEQQRVDRIENLLAEAEHLAEAEQLDVELIRSLLQQIGNIAMDDDHIGQRVDEIEGAVDIWLEYEEARRQAKAEESRQQQLEELIAETEQLAQADSLNIEHIRSLLNQISEIAIDDDSIDERVDFIERAIAERQKTEEARRQAEAEHQRQQKIEQLLDKAEKLSQADHLDVKHIQLLLEQITGLTSDNDQIDDRLDFVERMLAEWKQQEEDRKKARAERHRQQKEVTPSKQPTIRNIPVTWIAVTLAIVVFVVGVISSGIFSSGDNQSGDIAQNPITQSVAIIEFVENSPTPEPTVTLRTSDTANRSYILTPASTPVIVVATIGNPQQDNENNELIFSVQTLNEQLVSRYEVEFIDNDNIVKVTLTYIVPLENNEIRVPLEGLEGGLYTIILRALGEDGLPMADEASARLGYNPPEPTPEPTSVPLLSQEGLRKNINIFVMAIVLFVCGLLLLFMLARRPKQ
jgi:hypothetical protein